MTKKDYELIASRLKIFAAMDLSDRNANDVVFELTNAIKYALAQDNPRFDMDKFANAVFNK